VKLEESLLTLVEIESSSNYELERKTSISSALFLYISSSPTLLLLLPISIDLLSFYYNMSQHSSINLEQLV